MNSTAKKSRASTLVQSSRNCSDNIQNDIEKQNKIACYEGRPAEQIPCRRAPLSTSCRKPYIEPHEMLPMHLYQNYKWRVSAVKDKFGGLTHIINIG